MKGRIDDGRAAPSSNHRTADRSEAQTLRFSACCEGGDGSFIASCLCCALCDDTVFSISPLPSFLLIPPTTPTHGAAANMMRQSMLRTLARSPAAQAARANASRNTARTFATSARRQAEVELTIDGKKVSVEGRLRSTIYSIDMRAETDVLGQLDPRSFKHARKPALRSRDTATTRSS